MAATLTVDLNAKIAQFETEMKRATGTLDKFGKRGDAVAAGLKGAFAGMAAALSVGALASFAKSGIDAADSLNDMSARLGVTVKDLASFKLAAEQSGTSLEGIGVGISKLTKSIGEAENGNKKLAEALSTLGITARDPKEAFFQLADAVERIQDPAQRAALLSQVLGKSYGELVPLLNQGSDALRQSAKDSETFAESMSRLAPHADKFNDQLATLKINAAGAAASILSELVPSLNEYLAVGREVVNNGTLLDKVRFFGLGNASDEVVNRVRINLAASAGWMDKLRQSAGAANAASKKPSGDVKKTKSGGGRSSAKADPQGAFVDKLRQEASTLGLGSEALKKYEASKLKLTGTNAKLAAGFIAQIAAFNEQKAAAEENNKAFDEAIKKQDELDATLEGSIKSLRDWLTEQEFEASLIGKTNTERETAIQLLTLETAGIDTQAESYKALAAQIAAANSDRRGISILSGTQTEKTKEFMADIESIDKLFFDGKVGAAQFAEGIDLITGSTEKASKEMDTFAENAAKGIQSSLADFLFDPFDKGLDGMLEGFGKMLQRMIAEAAAAQIARELFGGLTDGGKTGGNGLAGEALSWIGTLFASANGNAFSNGAGLSAYSGTIVSTPTVFPFAKGMGLMGEAGPEAILPLKRGANGKLGVAGGGGGNNITVHVNGGNNAPDVRRAAGQGAREALGMLSGARRYG